MYKALDLIFSTEEKEGGRKGGKKEGNSNIPYFCTDL
jgi:hypothetical protein